MTDLEPFFLDQTPMNPYTTLLRAAQLQMNYQQQVSAQALAAAMSGNSLSAQTIFNANLLMNHNNNLLE